MGRGLAGLLLLLLAAPLKAQVLHGNEYIAGAALNIALRGPYVASAWRKPVPRFILGQAISFGYERFIDVNGWNWADVRGRLGGYLLTEFALLTVRLIPIKL